METSGDRVDEVVSREYEFYKAQTESDVGKLDEILSDGLTRFVHTTGKVDDKTKYLEAVKNGRYAHGPIFRLNGETRVFGNAAVTIGVIDMVSRPAGAAEFSMRVRQVLIWTKEDKIGWRLSLRHAVREPL